MSSKNLSIKAYFPSSDPISKAKFLSPELDELVEEAGSGVGSGGDEGTIGVFLLGRFTFRRRPVLGLVGLAEVEMLYSSAEVEAEGRDGSGGGGGSPGGTARRRDRPRWRLLFFGRERRVVEEVGG